MSSFGARDASPEPSALLAGFRPAELLPGILLCALLTLLAQGLQRIEQALFGQAYLEALVLALLLGVGLRSFWTPRTRLQPGIAFSARILLEIAVMLLGALVSVRTVLALGPGLLIGIAAVVGLALAAGFVLSLALGLPRRMAILVACGNAVCGNSAIAAVAPVIGASGEEIASSIAFTAVLGVIVVLLLPLLVPLLALSLTQYGVLAGLTVYAVPQVLAATLPIGALSNQVGTVVKLVRVLMLGPVVLALSLTAGRLRTGAAASGRLQLHQLLPWFIIGFLIVGASRSLGLIPPAMLPWLSRLTGLLTTVSMAALGLGVDIRVVARAGARVSLAVTLSLLVLGAISLGLIRLLRVA